MGTASTQLQQVQSWLESTKVSLDSVDPQLAETARALVFARVGRVYDTTLWVDQESTPLLVSDAIAMLIAAWTYDRQYAEVTSESENRYALKLENLAENLVSGIEAGNIDLDDANQAAAGESPEIPDYFPSQSSDGAEVYNGTGDQIGDIGDNDVKFTMSSRM
jgi:hypothetical protein